MEEEVKVGHAWGRMFRRLFIAFPQTIVDRLDKRSKGRGFVVKAIPFAIFILSLASVSNLASRAEQHHTGWAGNLTGTGIAILVPIAVIAAMLIEGNWRWVFWGAATVFALESGSIQYSIYATGLKGLSLEALSFGYGVPLSEVLLAIMEAQLVIQQDRKWAEEARLAEQQKVMGERLSRIAAEAEATRLEKEAERKRVAAIKATKDELDLRLYEQRQVQRIDLVRQRAEAKLKPIQKSDSVESNSESEEAKVIRFYSANPGASQRVAADSLNLSQPTISRILNRLANRNVATKTNRGFEIPQ